MFSLNSRVSSIFLWLFFIKLPCLKLLTKKKRKTIVRKFNKNIYKEKQRKEITRNFNKNIYLHKKKKNALK